LIYGFSVLNLNPLDKEIWSFMPAKLVYILNKLQVSKRGL
jgi:hypothetical protein